MFYFDDSGSLPLESVVDKVAGVLAPLIHIHLSLWQAGIYVLCMTQYLGIGVDTVMDHITTFQSVTDTVYDIGPIRLKNYDIL